MLNKNTWNKTVKKSKEEVNSVENFNIASTDCNSMMLHMDTCTINLFARMIYKADCSSYRDIKRPGRFC